MKNIVKILVSSVLLLAMILSVASCGWLKPGEEEFYIDGPASVTMQVGEIVVLDLVKPDSLKGKVEWTVDDNSIAEVVKGTIVAKAEGITVVHATLDEYSDKIIVTVTTPKDNTGSNTGNNGGSTGGNTGNNGGSTGDNTGNNGGSTGDNTGTGGNTGNSGGSTGDNTGNNGGSTGNNGGSTVSGLIGSIDFTSTAQRVSLSTAEQVWTNGSVTLTNTEGANPVADYSPIRFYPNSGVIIECQGMKKIVMNCDNGVKDSTGALQAAAEAAGASVVVDGETITITLPSVVNSFTMTVASQARVKTLEVYGN